MTETYTLTAAEAAMYDSQDDEQTSRLMTDLRARFGRIAGGAPVQTEVRHPDGFVVEQYTHPGAVARQPGGRVGARPAPGGETVMTTEEDA